MKKPIFVNDQIYHVYNRGVEKRQIFVDDYDYQRFIHDLFEFNDTAPAGKFSELRTPTVKRELLVEILCFCLMPNHFHLIIRQLVDGGITTFMRKVGLGYAMYFNRKNKRVGTLFQGRFKAILIENDEYFLQLSRYVHINPLELFIPNFKTEKINNWKQANDFLESYRWSSYPDYIGKKNYPSVISRTFLSQFFKNQLEYKKFINQNIVNNFDQLDSIIIE